MPNTFVDFYSVHPQLFVALYCLYHLFYPAKIIKLSLSAL
ncbi:hypothetical protein TREVI0001_1525 [Treponema vincentii ATCC 35580]|uniref:Uncharacterized protein n=1 Tax=Treponema vincentii ATCC 35580 TaxID=596324 RepID=C8PN21_9SPIR|nr:hypothetical protein TREVI0001_1525 [Treponema vincentii ATCC 35580]